MFGKHLRESRKCMNIKRYGDSFTFMSRSDAEHQWAVAKVCEGLAIWEMDKFGHDVCLATVLQKAINHDLLEIYTGDIKGPLKKMSIGFKDALSKIEKVLYEEKVKPLLPKSWRTRFDSLILNPKTNDIEGKILAAADIIDSMIEAIDEIEVGNNAFKKILHDNSKRLIDTELESVRYFIKYSFDDFDVDYNWFSVEFNEYRDKLSFNVDLE